MNNHELKVVTGHAQNEITEKKSRFIANVFEIHSEEEAISLIEAVRKKYYDARHNCYAYVAGGKNRVERFSDDGEPSGTAGKPILEVITRQGFENVLIVVTRYFGGVLLGTGGLTRAYSQAAVAGLSDAQDRGLASPLYHGIPLELSCDYSLSGKIRYIITQMGVSVTDTVYAGDVTFCLLCPEDVFPAFSKKITEATSAASEIKSKEPVCYILKDGVPVVYQI